MFWLLKVGLAVAAGVGLDRLAQKVAKDPDVKIAMDEARTEARKAVVYGVQAVQKGAQIVSGWAEKKLAEAAVGGKEADSAASPSGK